MKRSFALRLLAVSAAALALAALAGCSEDENGEDLSELMIDRVAGDAQHERPGAQLADPLVVRVRNLLYDPRPGVVVTFSSADPGAHVSPPTAVSDAQGLASCTFQLGVGTGMQHVRVAVPGDTTSFYAVADELVCTEESAHEVCQWPAGHIFVATTGSTLLPGTGTVVLDVDPEAGTFEEVRQTVELWDGISFSSRGELFMSKTNAVQKIDPVSHTFQDYIWGVFEGVVLEPNPGGVLVGLWQAGSMKIGCPTQDIDYLIDQHIYPNLDENNLAVDPVTRDLYMITATSSIQYTLWRFAWDGRSTPEQHDSHAILQVGASYPAGMCIDSTGTVYIVFDTNDWNGNYRRIVKVAADGAIDYDFFDFYARAGGNAQEAGHWGDIVYLNGRLYLIDKRNDRLVSISKNGVWLGEIKDTAFSRPLDESEHYAITASPTWICAGAAGPEARGSSKR